MLHQIGIEPMNFKFPVKFSYLNGNVNKALQISRLVCRSSVSNENGINNVPFHYIKKISQIFLLTHKSPGIKAVIFNCVIGNAGSRSHAKVIPFRMTSRLASKVILASLQSKLFVILTLQKSKLLKNLQQWMNKRESKLRTRSSGSCLLLNKLQLDRNCGTARKMTKGILLLCLPICSIYSQKDL